VLSDPDLRVRKNAVMVITHLILNDMMKVKGHIAAMAICLQVKRQSRSACSSASSTQPT
jgi:condensin complex subunit 1